MIRIDIIIGTLLPNMHHRTELSPKLEHRIVTSGNSLLKVAERFTKLFH